MPTLLAEILGPDLLVIVAIIALLFGGSQLPKLARSLGSAKREFEQGMAEGERGDNERGDNERTTAPEAELVTMSKRDLDQLLAEREAAASGDAGASTEPPL